MQDLMTESVDDRRDLGTHIELGRIEKLSWPNGCFPRAPETSGCRGVIKYEHRLGRRKPFVQSSTAEACDHLIAGR